MNNPGTDEHGETVPESMYSHLWTNNPKECGVFYPWYTYKDHFGKILPSYVPRAVVRNYLEGNIRFELRLWLEITVSLLLVVGCVTSQGLDRHIKLKHAVTWVAFHNDKQKFEVQVKDLESDEIVQTKWFDYVVNCTGHYSTPNIVNYEGKSNFKINKIIN